MTTLAIVGSGLKDWKRPEIDELRVKTLIQATLQILRPALVISGRSPAGGVDIWAEQEANRLGWATGVGFLAYPATLHRWEGPGGFKERDKQMAETCTHLLAIRSLWTTTYGSGWTHDRAAALGRITCQIQF